MQNCKAKQIQLHKFSYAIQADHSNWRCVTSGDVYTQHNQLVSSLLSHNHLEQPKQKR